jgi:hypothetical protein
MSLVITSNIDVNSKKQNSRTQTGLNRPFSYNNSIDNLFIPKNSEIAVQSVKVNREGSIMVSQANNKFALGIQNVIESYNSYLGTSVGTPAEYLPIQDSSDRIAFPFVNTIRNREGLPDMSLTYLDLQRAIRESMKLAVFPPMAQLGSLNSAGTTVSASINTNGEVVLTYDMNLVLNASLVNTASSLTNAVTTNYDEDANQAYTTVLTNSASGTTMVVSNETQDNANEATRERPTIFTSHALANSGGIFHVDLTQAVQGSNGHTDLNGKLAQQFSIGLTRPQLVRPFIPKDDITDPVALYYSPPWYSEYQYSHQGTGLGPGTENQYWDWVVKNEYDADVDEVVLKIYHTVSDWDDPDETFLAEVDYQSGLADNARFRVNNASFGIDAKGIEDIEFKVSNDVMEIIFYSNSQTHQVTISSNQYSGTNNGTAYNGSRASHMLKPVAETCWNLYPKIMLAPFKLGASPGNASLKNTITIDEFNGYTLTDPLGSTANYDGTITKSTKPDYYLKDSALGLPINNPTSNSVYSNFCCFYLHDLYSEPDSYPSRGNVLDTSNIMRFLGDNNTVTDIYDPQWKGLASDTLDVSPTILVGYSQESQNNPTEGFGNLTDPGLNSAELFGFNRFIIDDPTATSGAGLRNYAFEADKTSRTEPAISSFIRVRNLTHETKNMANRANSKILYHMPQFDSTGSDTGNLFFEASEKTYVKLNNTTDININSLDVDIVNSREQLATNYTGTTIVVFHIRKSKI